MRRSCGDHASSKLMQMNPNRPSLDEVRERIRAANPKVIRDHFGGRRVNLERVEEIAKSSADLAEFMRRTGYKIHNARQLYRSYRA